MGAVPIQGHGGEEGGESEVEGKRASASGGHWRPRVAEASRWGKFRVHEWGDREGMGNVHRSIDVREGNIARGELFSGWVGGAEGGRGRGAQVRVGVDGVELLAQRGRAGTGGVCTRGRGLEGQRCLEST